MNGVYLVHDHKVGILVLVGHGADNLLEKWITQFIVTSLIQFEVLYSAAELEEIFYDVLFLSTVLARIRLDH